MPGFFAHARGTVQRLRGPHRTPTPFRITLSGGVFQRALIQQAVIEHQGNYQFLHSINHTIYVYVFGDRIGELRIGGTTFLACDRQHGMTDVAAFYNAYRIASTGRPVAVAIGTIPAFSAFLTGIELSITDPENLLGTFSLRLAFFPRTGR